MQRRNFMQSSLLAGASLLTGAAAQAAGNKKTGEGPKAGEPFHLNYAIHNGMFHNHAGDNFIDQIKFAYDMG
jgi:hydroxypyruvate isomerase